MADTIIDHDVLDIAFEFLDAIKRKRPCKDTVYFILADDLVKIGVTDDVNARFRTLQTMSPVDLELLATIKCDRFFEKILHWRFRHLRAHGEWFRFEAEILNFVWKYAWNGEERTEWIRRCKEVSQDDSEVAA